MKHDVNIYKYIYEWLKSYNNNNNKNTLFKRKTKTHWNDVVNKKLNE